MKISKTMFLLSVVASMTLPQVSLAKRVTSCKAVTTAVPGVPVSSVELPRITEANGKEVYGYNWKDAKGDSVAVVAVSLDEDQIEGAARITLGTKKNLLRSETIAAFVKNPQTKQGLLQTVISTATSQKLAIPFGVTLVCMQFEAPEPAPAVVQ